MRTLFSEINPNRIYFIDTGTAHVVYVEESGNPQGIPVLFLHGGPCSGTKPDHRRFFDPQQYRIVLFDQRGCGQSTPFGELHNNTTQDLIEDMEHIRERLGVDQWLLFGGSWGATLALLYAQQYPKRTAAMILRGVFLARRQDMDWFVRYGANCIYPEPWRRLTDAICAAAGEDVIDGLYRTLWGPDELAQRRAAKEWTAWNGQLSLGLDYAAEPHDEHATEKLLRQVRMELHYAWNRYFIAENQILTHCDRLLGMPVIIIHGRNDLVCPMESGYSLHQALPHAEFTVLERSGHVARGEEMLDALVTATDTMAERLCAPR